MTKTDSAQPGAVFRAPDGSLWRLSAVIDRPMWVMDQVSPVSTRREPPRQIGAIGAPIWAGWERVS